MAFRRNGCRSSHPGNCNRRIDRPKFRGLSSMFQAPFKSTSQLLRVLGPSLLAPPFSSPDHAEFLTFARLYLGQRRDRIALSLGEVPCGSLPLFFPLLPSRVRHAAGGLIRGSPRLTTHLLKLILTLKTTMAHQSKPGTTQFALDLPLEAKMRFETLHESMGFKTKAQTFLAILYFVSTKDKIDPAVLQRIEKKIDHSIQLLESLI